LPADIAEFPSNGWLVLRAVVARFVERNFPDKKQVCPAGNFCIAGILSDGIARILSGIGENRYMCLKFRHKCSTSAGNRRKQNIDAFSACVTLHSGEKRITVDKVRVVGRPVPHRERLPRITDSRPSRGTTT
jgi:hypothetical protein